jgi:dihydrofolate synthase/folylpolyglutamate synthase
LSRGLSGARFRTLDEWLAWQETLHPRAIDLGLERVDRVHRHMGGARPAPLVITVAGTNGKGSTVALLEAIYLAAGYRVGSYTSPYLLRYNERVRIDGREVSDRQLCDTFARVDAARGDDTLTYFEFGTLAALDLFAAADLDIALLEVGMGGRLDAVNIIDADVALVTSIGVDHTAWLGDGPDDIAREKAGIFRAGRAAISADPDAPAALAIAARETGADWYAAGARFRVVSRGDGWDWKGPRGDWMDLPRPAAAGVHQLNNAAGALMAVQYLSSRLPVSREAVAAGLARAGVPGRIQRIGGDVEQWLDVAHNPQAAAALAGVLADDRGRGRTLAVIGMMADKDCRGFVTALSGQVDLWFATALQMPRASDPESLARCIEAVAGPACVRVCRDMAAAKRSALEAACAGDRVLVCGSFYTVAEWLNATGEVVG